MKNEVLLSGTLERVNIESDRFFGLVNVDGFEKWVPITAHEKDKLQRADLLKDLSRYQKGDVIVLKGYARAWSKQEGKDWKNGMDIRVIDLKPGTIPNREPSVAVAKPSDRQAPDTW